MEILILLVGILALVAIRRTAEQAAAIEALTARIISLERESAARETKTAPLPKPVPVAHEPAAREPDPQLHREPDRPAAPSMPPPIRPLLSPSTQPPATPPAVAHTPTPPPPAAPAVPPPPAAVLSSASRDSLETRIGARWLLYVGVVAIVIGVSYFEKLAIDNHWVNETARTIQAAVFGILLVYAGTRFVRAGYRVYGQMISGGGVATLYVATYAAFNFYHLIGRSSAFVVMSAITALAASLADRQRSQGLALMAVGGGFATPFLLPGEVDAEIALFTYDAILIAATMFLAHRRVWPLLNVVSYCFTILTVLGWAARFYEPAKYLPTQLFLTLFCGMYLYVLHEMLRPDAPALSALSTVEGPALSAVEGWRVRLAQAILWTAPVFYYLGSLAVLTPHSLALLVYLVGLSVVAVVSGVRINTAVRLLLWIAVFVPLALWSDSHGNRTWILSGLAAVAGIYAIHLLADLERVLRDDATDPIAIMLFHLNALASYGCAYLLIDAVDSRATAPAAAGFALWHVAIAIGLANRRRIFAMHSAAVASALLAIAIALQFHGAATIAGWAAEGAGVAWLGLRERREWFRAGGLALVCLAIVQLLQLQASAPPVGQTVMLNQRAAAGLLVTVAIYALAWLHHRHRELPHRMLQVGIGLSAATLLVLTVATSEITAYWQIHSGGYLAAPAQIAIASFLDGSLIVWLGLARRQDWMRGVGGLVVSAGLLLLLGIQFQTARPGYVIVFNPRALAGVLAVATLYTIAALHSRRASEPPATSPVVAILLTLASLFTLSLLTSEIDAYWGARGAAAVWSIAREGLQAIVWAAVASLVIWLGVNRRIGAIRTVGAGLMIVAVARLLRLQLAAAPAGYVVLVNARLTASAIVVAALYGIARLYQSQSESLDGPWRPRAVLLFLANLLSLTLLTSEITAYWHVRDMSRVVADTIAVDSHFARELMLSITWAVYATALIVAGIRKRYAPIRYFAIGLFAVTIVKVFGFDMADLDRIYRVSSIIVLGVMLLATSYLYNRFRSQLTANES